MRKMFKRLFVVSLSFMIFSSSVLGATEVENVRDSFILLDLNEEYTSQIFNANKHIIDKGWTLKTKFTEEEVFMSLKCEDFVLNIELSGSSQKIKLDNMYGYVGVYEGEIDCSRFITLGLNQNGNVPVIVDATYTKHEAFVRITLGYCTEDCDSLILCFGEISEAINNLNNVYYSSVISEMNNGLIGNSGNNPKKATALDSTITYRGSEKIYGSTYQIGLMNIYHSKEITNSGVTSVHVKVNTFTENFRDFLIDVIKVKNLAPMIYADQFVISVRANSSDLAIISNSHKPVAGVTKQKIHIPYYIPPKTVGYYDFNLTTSSIIITDEKYGTSINTNGAKWVITKNGGWGYKVFDGDNSSETGMSISLDYRFNGDNDVYITKGIQTKSSIRYLYFVDNGNGVIVSMHYTTPLVSQTTHIGIRP